MNLIGRPTTIAFLTDGIIDAWNVMWGIDAWNVMWGIDAWNVMN
jgi:hypothetical protein